MDLETVVSSGACRDLRSLGIDPAAAHRDGGTNHAVNGDHRRADADGARRAESEFSINA